jgi:hypothetical protein
MYQYSVPAPRLLIMPTIKSVHGYIIGIRLFASLTSIRVGRIAVAALRYGHIEAKCHADWDATWQLACGMAIGMQNA